MKVDPDFNGCARKNLEASRSIYTFGKKARYGDFESLQQCALIGGNHEYKCRSEYNLDLQFYDPGYCQQRQSQPKKWNKCDQANLDYYGKNSEKYNDLNTMVECMPRDSHQTFFSHVRTACSFVLNLIDRDVTNLGSGIYCSSTNPTIPFRMGGKLYTTESFIPAKSIGGNGR